MAYLSFVSDDDLISHVKEVLTKVQTAEATAEQKLYNNIIDPFSALFDAMNQNITLEEWLGQEKTRQVQKTLQNALGDFHQKVLGSIAGWVDAGRGGSFDIKNDNLKIIAEVKNKHNTMNSSSSEATYQKLVNHLRYAEKGYVAYVVFIVPRSWRPLDTPWSPNLQISKLRDDIRQIDGASFYELASGERHALRSLYATLPQVIRDISGRPTGHSEPFVKLFDQVYSK